MSREWNQLAVQKLPPRELNTKLQLPVKTLTSPGPTNCSERVLSSLQNQVLGPLHPEICQVIGSFSSCKKKKVANRYKVEPIIIITNNVSVAREGED